MKKLLDLLPEVSWTWNFGSSWDWLIIFAGVGLLGYIVYSAVKANKDVPKDD